jgi:hypothetical protein
MNAEISYNGRVANQAAQLKGKIHAKVDRICEVLDVQPEQVYTTQVEPQLSETNTWLAQLNVKLDRIIEINSK